MEFAIGLVALSIIEAQQADAAIRPDTFGTGADNAAPADEFHKALGRLADIDPSTIKTLTVEELKALLTGDALASLGLDAGFAKLLDIDPQAAVRKLEAAFRKKLTAVAHSNAKIAAADHVSKHGEHLRDGEEGHHEASLLGGIPIVWAVLGAAAVGGIAVAASSGGGSGHGNDAPVAGADSVTTNEDTAVTFDVRTNDTDRNGDSLTVTQINGTAISTTSPVTITGGVVSLGADGRLTFTPTANYNGTPSFTYVVSDGKGGTSTATVSLTVTAVNDAPVAVNDSFTVAEDNSVTINVRGNDSDVDGDTLTVTQVNGRDVSATTSVAVTGGSVILNAAGNLVFTPTANYNGSPSFTYTISDGKGGTATATVSGTVTAVNDAPVAVNDSFTVAEDNSIVINVRGNDSDVDGDTLTVTQVNGTAVSTTVAVAVTGGSVILNAAGNLVFTPIANYNGSPSFTYTVSDGNGGTATATVSGTVTAVNDAPVAVNDTFTVAEDNSVIINVRANDSDVDGDTLTVTQVNGKDVSTTTAVAVTGGSVVLNVAGNLVFTPTANYNGSPSFTYTVSDGKGGTATATVNGTVTAVNDAPVAVNDSFTTLEDTSIIVNVRANDGDVDGDTLTVTHINGQPISSGFSFGVAGAIITLNSAGNLVVSPSPDFNGRVTFTYTVADGHGGTATATVVGTITAVNDAPSVFPTQNFTTAEDQAVTLYVIKASSSGANAFYQATDRDGDTLSITQVNGQSISVTRPVAVTGGSVSLNADGNLVFTSNKDYNGSPTFTYTVSDGNGGFTTGTLSGSVTPVNDAPVNGLTTLTLTATAGVPVTVPGLSVSDVDSSSLTTTVKVTHGLLTLGTVANGAVVTGAGTMTLTLTGTQAQINASLAALTFTGTAGFSGADTLTIATSDGQLTDTDTLTLNVGQVLTGVVQDGYIKGATVFFDANGNGVYDAGETIAQTDATGHYALTVSGPTVGNIVAFGGINIDTGLPNQTVLMAPAGSSVVNPLTTLVSQLIGGGMTEAQATAQLVATLGLSTGFDLTHFDFLSPGSDAALGLAVQKIATQIVTLVNQGIAAGSSSAAVTASLGRMFATGAAVDLTSTATLNSIFTGAGLSASAAATASTGAAAINQKIADATSVSDLVRDLVKYGGTNADLPPVAADDAATTTQGKAITINVLANDKDPEGGALKVVKINGVSIAVNEVLAITGGSITLGADGKLTFTPNAAYSGTPSFTYTVQDAGGNTQDATVQLTVTAIAQNVVPVAHADMAATALGTAVSIDVLANDTDANGDQLSVTAINGVAITTNGVAVNGGTVSLGADGKLVFTPTVGFVGTSSFDYTASDGHGGMSTASTTVTIAPSGPVYGIAAGDFQTVLGNGAALHAAGVTTLDIAGSGDLVISSAQAEAMIAAGLTFAADDSITVAGQGTHLSTTLKGLQDLHVDTMMIAGGVTHVVAGESLAGIAAGGLPHFVGPNGADADVTLDLQSGNFGTADLAGVASALATAGIDHLDVLGGGAVSLGLTQAQQLAAAHVDFTTASDVTLNVTSAQAAALDAGLLGSLHVDHIDVTTNAATISDAEASALVAAGVDFVASDAITVTAAGTHLSTTLKGLQDLHVDTVMIAGGVGLHVAAGESLAAIATASLPHFVTSTGGDADVTLDLQSGDIASVGDLSTIAANLAAAGVDHLDVLGGGAVSLGLGQAQQLAAAHIDFTPAADVTLNVNSVQAVQLASNASLANQLHVDHLHVDGAVTLTEAQAANLIAAGLDFAASDAVTVQAAGTHLSTTLKGLQDLHVDTVMIAGGAALTIAAGTGDLGSLAAHDLPHFANGQDVTVDIASGTLSGGFDFGHVGMMLEQSGVDHIGVSGSGALSLTVAQAESFAMSGLDFAPQATVSIDAAPAEIAALANNPFVLAGLNIDQIHATAPVTITDVQATNLIEAGLHFADANAVMLSVSGAGTHLSTTLKGLQDLHVDSIAVQAGVTSLHIDAGDLHTVTVGDLPQFDVAQSNAALDVTLRVDASEVSDVIRLADALGAAGVDHIAFNQPVSSFSASVQAQLANAAATSHLTFATESFTTADAFGSTSTAAIAAATAEHSALVYRDLLTTFEANADTHGHGGVMQLIDGAASSLAEAGMLRAYTAETLVVDGTTSGDKLLTTLKDIADIGVDQVKLADQAAKPVYVDLGIQNSATAVSDIQMLFKTLDLEGHATGTIFSGNEKVGLVVDANTAKALSHVDGALGHLASLGFTEVDVLATPGVGAPAFGTTPGIEVKVIGQDDPLYNHLHHG